MKLTGTTHRTGKVDGKTVTIPGRRDLPDRKRPRSIFLREDWDPYQ